MHKIPNLDRQKLVQSYSLLSVENEQLGDFSLLRSLQWNHKRKKTL